VQTLTLLIGGSRNGQLATDNILKLIELEKTEATLKLNPTDPPTSTNKEIDRYWRREIKGHNNSIAVYVVENLPPDEWIDNLKIAQDLSKDVKHQNQIQTIIEILQNQH
jgi:hypothetical protein